MSEVPAPVPPGMPREDDMDELLRQYDDEMDAARRAQPEAEPDVPAEVDEQPTEPPPWTPRGPLEHETLSRLEQAAERDDVLTVMYQARQALPEIAERGLSDEMLLAWLRFQYESDPRTQRDWDNRHRHPQQAERRIRGLISKLGTELRSWPDREATSIRNDVVAAMMRNGTGKRPEAPAPDLSRMSNAEFDRYTASLGMGSRIETWGS